jgi:hypothetical protein
MLWPWPFEDLFVLDPYEKEIFFVDSIIFYLSDNIFIFNGKIFIFKS